LTPIEIELLPIPASLRSIPQWGAWRYEVQDGKPKKPAFCSKTRKLKPSEPLTWLSLAEAWELVADPSNNFNGLGFCFGGIARTTGIDFDHCRNKETGALAPVEGQLIKRLDSYTEVSPSGTGVHVLVNAKLTGRGRRGAGIEVYCEGRYFTVTGTHIANTPVTINDRQAAVDALVTAMPIIDKLRADETKRTTFETLFLGDLSSYHNDHSVADLALCSMAAWAGATDEQIDALMRLSGLYRKKWERPDYRSLTISKAKTRTYSSILETPQEPRNPQVGGVVPSQNGDREDFRAHSSTYEPPHSNDAWDEPVDDEEEEEDRVYRASQAVPDNNDYSGAEDDFELEAAQNKTPSRQGTEATQAFHPDTHKAPQTTGGSNTPDPLQRSGIRSLSAIPARKPTYLWEPYIPRGVLAILAGDTGTGKSTVASLIAARLSLGQHPYTGEPNGEPENVIIATSEDDPSCMLKPRLEAYGADPEHIWVLPIPSIKDVGLWERLLRAKEQPALLIVDPMQEAFGDKVDERRASQTRAVLAPLLPLVQRYRTTILFLCHLPKDAAEKKAQHRVLGSVDIGAATRSIMLMEKSEQAGHSNITHVKNNFGEPGEPLVYRIVAHEIEPGWPVGIAEWIESPTPQDATKMVRGINLATTYLKERGGECERKALEAYLAAQGIKGGTAARVLSNPCFKTLAKKITLISTP
jgi:hypothetical protein